MEKNIHNNKSELATLEINSHTFYVDFELKKLRSKDDDKSKGIPFDVFEDHFNSETNRCEIPYDKRRHEFVPIDYATITEIPKDVVVVGFPHLKVLNPEEYSLREGAKTNFQHPSGHRHFTATILKGNGDWLEFLVMINKQELPALKWLRK